MAAEVTSLFIVSEGTGQQQITEALDAQTVFFTEAEAHQFISDNQKHYDNTLEVVRFNRG